MPTRIDASKRLFLDANAGVPLLPQVAEDLSDFIQSGTEALDSARLTANPSSIHRSGRLAKRRLSEAREQVAASLGDDLDPEQIVFTSSGSEANQSVIRSQLEPHLQGKSTVSWVTSPVEHDSVRQMQQDFLRRGGQVIELPIDSQGKIDVHALNAVVQEDTALVSLVWANNETGVISDVVAAANILHQLNEKRQTLGQSKVVFHVDGAQAWGKLPIQFNSLPWDYLTLSGHKIGAPAGIGVIVGARGRKISGLVLGHQELGRRGGTENLLGIIGLGAASRALPTLLGQQDQMTQLRNQLQELIVQSISGVRVNGVTAPRIANTLNLSFTGISGEGLVMALDLAGYAVSAGSACASGVLAPSHVLRAMGLTSQMALASIRISLAPYWSLSQGEAAIWQQLQVFVRDLAQIISRMRGLQDVHQGQISVSHSSL